MCPVIYRHAWTGASCVGGARSPLAIRPIVVEEPAFSVILAARTLGFKVLLYDAHSRTDRAGIFAHESARAGLRYPA